MQPNAYTIRIFVPDGDPEGIRVIDRLNWTGTGIVFPRTLWPQAKSRPEFEKAGVYILVGYGEGDEELPRVYVGEGDGIRGRIEKHHLTKAFWSWGIAFVSSGGLNKAHVQWLEYALVKRAQEAKRCVLDNGNTPQRPNLTEHEEADVHGFLFEILRILPLVDMRVFEKPRAIIPIARDGEDAKKKPDAAQPDTVIVPAQKEGFDRVFLGEHAWRAIRISGAMLDKIKFIAAYQAQPVSAVTHVARVKQIEPYGDSGKYQILFAGPAEEIKPIPFADAAPGSMQGPRYTTIAKLKTAKKVSDLY